MAADTPTLESHTHTQKTFSVDEISLSTNFCWQLLFQTVLLTQSWRREEKRKRREEKRKQEETYATTVIPAMTMGHQPQNMVSQGDHTQTRALQKQAVLYIHKHT